MFKKAYIDELTLITIPFTEAEEELSDFLLINSSTSEQQRLIKWSKKEDRLRYELYLEQPIELGVEYKLIVNERILYQVNIGQVVRTRLFDDLYSYEGKLGTIYSKASTIFKLWAPTATEVELVLTNGEEVLTYPITKKNKGVWEEIVHGNLDGMIYLYRVKVDGLWREAVDPYAKAVTINGEKGVIVNPENTNPKGWSETVRPFFNKSTDAVIYELHIRDFSICKSSGIINKGKYLGLTERGTRGPWGTLTGLDYVLDLGVTHVQLLPVQDFGSVNEVDPDKTYNWGYDTIHFSAIEGSYSLNPGDPKTRIKELKTVIQSFHENGLRVIFDVVYNHMFIHERSNLEKIVPGYYFRYHLDGSLSNGTGVGNDIASEREMVRKLIVDSVKYLAEEYQVDGFRFDLMGNLDIDTMQQIRQTVTKIDPSILIIGEGWDLPTALANEKKATIANSDQLPGISHFNDQFRDKLKGNIFDHQLKGFCNGNSSLKEDFKMLVSGSTKDFYPIHGMFNEPYKSVNYVECHDNHTLWDKLAIANGDQSEATRKMMHRLATAMTILSQGIPFLHAGQEFFRSKQGIENSYCSRDEINKLDWERKALHMDYVEYVKSLIAIRKSHGVFRFMTRDEVKKKMHILDTPSYCLAYMLKNCDGMFVVAHNGSEESKEIILPSNGIWQVFVEFDQAAKSPLRQFDGSKINIGPISTSVFFHPKSY